MRNIRCLSTSLLTEPTTPAIEGTREGYWALTRSVPVCVLHIFTMYTVTFYEISGNDSFDAVRECFDSYQEAKAFAKSFEDWDDVRLDYVPSLQQINNLIFWKQ